MECQFCHKELPLISEYLKVCVDCLMSNFFKVKSYILEVHKKTREDFNLPIEPPKDENGLACNLCVNECRIPLNKRGFCGLRENFPPVRLN